MLGQTGWRILLLLSICVVWEVAGQQRQVLISQIHYTCRSYPCPLRICGYVLPSLSQCPLHTTTCPDTHCATVIVLGPTTTSDSVRLSLDYPTQLKSILNIKVYLPQSGSLGTCGNSLRDSCWDFTYTNRNLITGSSLSFQVQLLAATIAPTTGTKPVVPGTSPHVVLPTQRPVTNPLPTPLTGKSTVDGKDGFPAAAAFGIALGIAVLIIIIAIIICLCCKKKKKETVVAVVSSPQTNEKPVYPAPLRYEEYMKSGPLPVVQDGIDGDGGSDTSYYQIEVVADASTSISKKKRKKKRKTGKHSRRGRDRANESDYSRTTGENYHIASDTFFINASTLPQSEDIATPITLPPLTPVTRPPSKKYKKKRKMASYDFTEFDRHDDPYAHM